jgi:hypothetical protein
VGTVGERVDVSLSAGHLNRISLALFGPPLIWVALMGLILAGSDAGLAVTPAPLVIAVAGGIGLALAMGLGVRFSRRQENCLDIAVTPVEVTSLAASEV